MTNDWEEYKSAPLFYSLYGQEEFTKEQVLELCKKSFEAGHSYGYIEGKEYE